MSARRSVRRRAAVPRRPETSLTVCGARELAQSRPPGVPNQQRRALSACAVGRVVDASRAPRRASSLGAARTGSVTTREVALVMGRPRCTIVRSNTPWRGQVHERPGHAHAFVLPPRREAAVRARWPASLPRIAGVARGTSRAHGPTATTPRGGGRSGGAGRRFSPRRGRQLPSATPP